MNSSDVHTLNRAAIDRAMKAKGVRTISELAKKLKVHRNTLGYFLSGKPVFAESISKMINYLEIAVSEAIVTVGKEKEDIWKKLSPVVDTLHQEFPAVTFILFGSRARGSNRNYSDVDLGVFSAAGVTTAEYLMIINRVEELAEDLPWQIEVVNLTNASQEFLESILPDSKFLTGRRTDWIKFRNLAEGSR